LANGQITIEGPFLDAGDSTLAITGGTGAHANARGEMLLHALNAQGSEYDFTYTINKYPLSDIKKRPADHPVAGHFFSCRHRFNRPVSLNWRNSAEAA
jgi:hypothetical protein